MREFKDYSCLRLHENTKWDDPGAAGGPGSPGGPGKGGHGGFRRSFSNGVRGPDRGCGRGRGRGREARGGKLGRLVKDMKIKSLKEIYLFSLPIKEFKAFIAIGDYNGHVGLGDKCSKEVATAIHGAIILAKLSIVPVQRGYWRNKIVEPHTVLCKRHWHYLTPVPKKLLMMAGIDDCYTSARGCTATLGNYAKATFDAISKTYSYLTPDLWKETVFSLNKQEFTDHLVKTHTRVSMKRTQAPAIATT
ncbi:hypothetical protein MJT46_001515 [Ovis ammon polii x Ovis aries]|nr:hypothetical protein MJT46_001515 [Ovis ammon polii x Ovis aries]